MSDEIKIRAMRNPSAFGGEDLILSAVFSESARALIYTKQTLVDDIVAKLAERYVEENYQEIVAKLDVGSLVNVLAARVADIVVARVLADEEKKRTESSQ